MPAISNTPDRVVIAIDPHKASWTAAAVDASSQPVAVYTGASSRIGEAGDELVALRRRSRRVHPVRKEIDDMSIALPAFTPALPVQNLGRADASRCSRCVRGQQNSIADYSAEPRSI
jgi:hypothetical protein